MSRPRRDVEFLPRLISKWGHCSRREAERLVAAGRVTVNGRVQRQVLWQVHPQRDQIVIDGATLRPADYLYLKLHKPLGVVTTMKDPQGRPTIADLIPPQWRGAMPVGRLDQDSTGLLLVTNDHSLGDRITGPRHLMKKVYRVEIAGRPETQVFEPIRAGIVLGGREQCRPAKVEIVARAADSTTLEIVLDEGKFRQIRRSLQAVEQSVLALHRTRIGPIELGSLAPGELVQLTAPEITALRG